MVDAAPPPTSPHGQTLADGAKDVVTTSLSGHLWAAVGGGIVNEVFWPAVDQPQIKDFGFLIRADDGGTSEWVEVKAQSHYTVEPDADLSVPLAELRHTGPFYELALQPVPDPLGAALLVGYRLSPAAGAPVRPLQLYPLLAPHLGHYTATSGDGVGADTIAWTRDGMLFARTSDPQHPVVVCLAADPGFSRVSAGYVGDTDGWTDLHRNSAMTWEYALAGPGVVALTGELLAPTGDLSGTLALGFGTTEADAESAARGALSRGIDAARDGVRAQWREWAAALKLPTTADGLSSAAVDAVRQSATVLKTCQDRDTGGVVASLATPWGTETNDPGGYHMVWCRDGSETALALAALGDIGTAAGLLEFLAQQQHSDAASEDFGSWGRCYFLDGSALPGLQLDETAFPVLLAAKLTELGAAMPSSAAELVRGAVTYLVRQGPVQADSPGAPSVDRWEETAGGSPFTIALVVVALVAAAGSLAPPERDYVLSLADDWNQRIEEFCYVAGTGIDQAYGVAGHYVRVGPVEDTVRLGNSLDPNATIQAEAMVGMEFLYLPRLGLRAPDDTRITDTLTVVEAMLRRETASGDVYGRYDLDGYGEWLDGSGWPVRHFGIGRPWPLLAGERGHFDVLAGRGASRWLDVMLATRGRGGLLPEQVWDSGDLPWRGLSNGRPTGSAMPLAWAHSELVKLALTAVTSRPVERLAAVEARYPGGATPTSDTWHWRTSIPVLRLPPAGNLQVEDTRPFTLHFGFDGWQEATVTDRDATALPFGMWGVSLDADSLAGHASLEFTRRYGDSWEGLDHAVALSATPRTAHPLRTSLRAQPARRR